MTILGWSTSLPGPGRGRAHRCLDLPGESVAAGTPKEERAPLPGLCNGTTAARIPRSEAHLCQDPAWSAPLPGPCVGRPAVPAPRVPVAILVHVLGSPAVFSIPVPGLRRVSGRPRPHSLVTVPPPAPFRRASAAAALALPAEAACALCQRAPREPVRADCGHRFCRACVVRFWAEEDWTKQSAWAVTCCGPVRPRPPPLPGPFSYWHSMTPTHLVLKPWLCCGPLGGAPDPGEKPAIGESVQENKGSVEIMRKDLNDARDLHGQAESAAAVWKGHVMDRRKKALTDYKKLRAFFAEEEERFLQEADKEEGSAEDEDTDPAERFGSLLQAVSELERRHRNLGLSMLLQ
ncbi:E3 ubiquitin-protein ligase RNF187 [Herpailurus yagouaroundi]|uniref:E3 ubiquitin-protein ligase RNF187 n=1 Tax=Herpailurus yagouaroundi TaxID=1608482 RepID=UPI001AD784C0|nr:E3 ubiquitin-protein ligase RNF187 [Puma yagouaroundi]